MMNLNEWQQFNESLAGMTLGLRRPPTVGGLVGSRLRHEWEDDDDDDDDFDGEHLEGDDDDDDDDDFRGKKGKKGKKGDLVGSSDADEGPDKNWPPDSEEEEGGLPTPDEEMLDSQPGDFAGDDEGDDDFLASLGAGGGGEGGFDDEFGGGGLEDLEGLGGDLGGEEGGFGGDLGGEEGGFGGDLGGEEGGFGGEMDFLNDINPELLGGEFGGEEDGLGGEMGGEMGGDMEGGSPCPDCNPDGHEIGDPDCETCDGVGFLDDGGEGYGPELTGDEGLEGLDGLDGEEEMAGIGGHEEMAPYMSKMAQYMKKYMRKEWNQFSEFAPAVAAAAPALMGGAGAGAMGGAGARAGGMGGGMMGQMGQMGQQAAMGAGQNMMQNKMQAMDPAAQQQMRKRMVKFMSKKGERSFMAADAPKHRKPKWKKHCPCETTQYREPTTHNGYHSDYQCSDSDFIKSLAGAAQGTKRGSSGITEDALFALADPNAEYAKGEPRPGDYGFAPQVRVGSIGGGYTMDDFQELPTLGESVSYPTLAEYAAYKARKKAARRRR